MILALDYWWVVRSEDDRSSEKQKKAFLQEWHQECNFCKHNCLTILCTCWVRLHLASSSRAWCRCNLGKVPPLFVLLFAFLGFLRVFLPVSLTVTCTVWGCSFNTCKTFDPCRHSSTAGILMIKREREREWAREIDRYREREKKREQKGTHTHTLSSSVSWLFLGQRSPLVSSTRARVHLHSVTHIHTHTQIHAHARKSTHARKHTHTHTQARPHARTHKHTHTHTHTFTLALALARAHSLTETNTNAHTVTQKDVLSHTHTRTKNRHHVHPLT